MQYKIYIQDEQLRNRIKKALHSLFVYKKISQDPVIVNDVPSTDDDIIFTDSTRLAGKTVLYLGTEPHLAGYSLPVANLKLSDFKKRIDVFESLMGYAPDSVSNKEASVVPELKKEEPKSATDNEQIKKPQSATVDSPTVAKTDPKSDDSLLSGVNLKDLGISSDEIKDISKDADESDAVDPNNVFEALGFDTDNGSNESLEDVKSDIPQQPADNSSASYESATSKISNELGNPENVREEDQIGPAPENPSSEVFSQQAKKPAEVDDLFGDLDEAIKSDEKAGLNPKVSNVFLNKKKESEESIHNRLKSKFNGQPYDVDDHYDVDALKQGKLELSGTSQNTSDSYDSQRTQQPSLTLESTAVTGTQSVERPSEPTEKTDDNLFSNIDAELSKTSDEPVIDGKDIFGIGDQEVSAPEPIDKPAGIQKPATAPQPQHTTPSTDDLDLDFDEDEPQAEAKSSKNKKKAKKAKTPKVKKPGLFERLFSADD